MASESRVSEVCGQFTEKNLAYTIWVELVTARCPQLREALLSGLKERPPSTFTHPTIQI